MSDHMWKSHFEKVLEARNHSSPEHDLHLQNTDGGFFEKFGLLLRQNSEIHERDAATQLASFDEKCSKVNLSESELEQEEEQDLITPSNVFQLESYSKGCDEMHFRDDLYAKATGINIEDLYAEIIFEICNYIGCGGGYESNSTTETLFDFAQIVFNISEEKHEETITLVRQKAPPSLRLNVEIIKAENLIPKDSNGLSDPFVTLYLESNSSCKYNTSVKTATVNPNWEENFSLPIADTSPYEETLQIEVWDFDAAETIKEKANKIFDVKGIRGFRKLMKEIAITASTGKNENELIGRTSINLRSIPNAGITLWYNLEKGSSRTNKSRGSILINLAINAEKNKKVAIREHRHLLKLLLLHELEESQVAPFWWNGTFSSNAEIIRSQHSVHSGLSLFECTLSNWAVYTSIHEDHPLSFSLFIDILNVVVPVLKCLHSNSEDVKVFWEGVRRILPSCFSIIRNLRCKKVAEKHSISLLCEVLDILAIIKSLKVPLECELFPKNLYAWLPPPPQEEEDTTILYDIDQVVNDATTCGTKEWFEQIIETRKSVHEEEISDEDYKLQYLIRIIQLVRSDLQRAMEYYDKHFYQKLKISFSSIVFKFYDSQLVGIIKTTVTDICSQMKRLDVPDENLQFFPNSDDINMGTELFELYLILKQFTQLGKALCPDEQQLNLEDFYISFMPGVTHWLDISVLKALTRINRAIELDTLKVVDETVKYSSSAIDTLAIFYQIKIFWQQLDWPDVESSYTYLAKIIDDICRCCIFYARKMSCRIGNDYSNDELFEISLEWCIAINNIDYLRQSLPSFIKEFGTDSILEKLRDQRSILEADRCALTIKTQIENALDIQRNQIIELIEIVGKKIAPSLKKLLAEGAEVVHINSNSMDKLMLYLENSLSTLSEALNEINFKRILDAIWSELAVIMYDLIQTNIEKQRPPNFFKALRQTLRTMVQCFNVGNIQTSNVHVLAEIERILDIHSRETIDLIHQYYINQTQKEMDTSSTTTTNYGKLTIKAHFTESSLELIIMNARNLVPVDKNGICNPFVKASFIPFDRFAGICSIKTGVQNRTCFPLFDEVFTINLSEEQLSYGDSLIIFCIKEKDLFGMKHRQIAECYITFSDIRKNEDEQLHLNLIKPEYEDSDIITQALEQRQGDKQAKAFLKKLKSK